MTRKSTRYPKAKPKKKQSDTGSQPSFPTFYLQM